MIPDSSSHENPRRDYSPPTDTITARVDALLAQVEAAEVRIDEALRPEPVDWERHYADVFAFLANVAETLARTEGGA